MKKFIIFFMVISVLLTVSCSNSGGSHEYVNIGEDTIEISFKETEEIVRDFTADKENMFSVIDSVIRTMEYYALVYSDDVKFMWKAISVMLNYSAETTVDGEGIKAPVGLIYDYFSACFSGVAVLPELTEDIKYDADSNICTVQKITGINYNDTKAEITDFIDNGDEKTYTVYADYINTSNNEIINRYIFTLIKNPASPRYTKQNFAYSVTSAIIPVF